MKGIIMVKHSFIFSLLLLASSNILACNPDQGTGQCGYRGANGAIYNSYGEAQNSYQKRGTINNSVVKIVKQPDSFAAMASSTKSGKVATVTHKHSIAEANKEAIRKCERATGEKCDPYAFIPKWVYDGSIWNGKKTKWVSFIPSISIYWI